jgi:hypothetical protein
LTPPGFDDLLLLRRILQRDRSDRDRPSGAVVKLEEGKTSPYRNDRRARGQRHDRRADGLGRGDGNAARLLFATAGS